MSRRRLALAVSLALSLATARAQALAHLLSTQGYLLEGDEVPVDGVTELTFKLWKAPNAEASGGTTPVWSSTLSVQVRRGRYAAVLGDVERGGTAFPADAFSGDRWMSVTIANTELLPRALLATTPQAAFADVAATADHADEADHAARADRSDKADLADLATKATRADLADDLECDGCVASAEIAGLDGSKVAAGTLPWASMAALPASPPAIANLGATHDHDERYWRKTDLAAGGSGSVDWTRVANVSVGAGLTKGEGNALATAFAGTGSAITAARSDHRHDDLYAKADGSTPLTGALKLADSNPTDALHATSKGYADTHVAGVKTSYLTLRSVGANGTGNLDRNVVLNGTDLQGNSRGLAISVINRTTHAVVETKAFDTHDPAIPSGGTVNAADAMATYLDALGSDVFVAIAAYDAWTTGLTSKARLALSRVGASQLVHTIPTTCCTDADGGRSSYALVGIPGVGLGGGLERSGPSGTTVVELAVMLVGPNFVGSGDHGSGVGYWAQSGTAVSSGSATWVDIPGTKIVFTLGRRSLVRMDYTLSLNASTNGNHCGIRFVVDDVAQGNSTYGNTIQMGVGGQHWQTVADSLNAQLPRGEHHFRVQLASVQSGSCSLDNDDYSRPWVSATAYPY